MAEKIGSVTAIASIPASVKETLKRTMVFGMPTDEADQPTFVFEREVSFADHDREESPWDWTAAPISESIKDPVRAICAYQFFSPLGRQGSFITEVGDFDPTTLVLTMFEEEFNSVAGFSYCTIGAVNPGAELRRWYFRYWRPTYALANLEVFQVHCVAGDVS